MEHLKSYQEANKERYLEELMDLLRIPSVSADSNYDADVLKTADFIKNKLIEAGAENVEVCETAGFPIVYADKIIDPNLPTVCVYGHYDVQPADPVELWDSGPFDPIIKKTAIHPEGAIFARGACDDKGQMYMHVKAFENMVKNDALPCNVKFMIEGEEEVGSPSLGPFIREHADKFACDVVLVSDTGMIANDVPSICTGLRGLSYVEVEVV